MPGFGNTAVKLGAGITRIPHAKPIERTPAAFAEVRQAGVIAVEIEKVRLGASFATSPQQSNRAYRDFQEAIEREIETQSQPR